MDSNEPGSIALTAEQVAEIENENLQINFQIEPKISEITDANGVHPIDWSQVRLVGHVETRKQRRIFASDYVRNTRGELKRLAKAQFDLQLKDLLDKHFE